MLQLLLNIVEFGMPVAAAVEAPRFSTRHLVSSFDNHSVGPGVLLVDERISTTTRAGLSTMGHKAQRSSMWNAGAAPVLVHVVPTGVLEAAADPYGYRVARAW
jgi:gamma-glutamyltranspeptidase/glutathione hydrolase